MGGSSSINGMLYVRGAPADFDGWAQMGCRGWSYDDVLPYFKKSEHYVQGGDAEVRGQGGPLKVEDYRTILPLTHRFVEAAQQAGFPFNPDLNGKQRAGVGYSQMTRRGRFRGSTAQTFLREARGRPNLRVETEAQGGKLLFEGKRCVGVTFQRGGNLTEVRANREVIVSGGTINSPHILQISGIGPAAHLQSLGIPGGARPAGRRLEPDRPLRDPRRPSRARHADRERDRALPARAAGDPALLPDRQGRAHLRRHHGAGLLRQPRGPGLARPAAPVHAGQHASAEVRPARRASPA